MPNFWYMVIRKISNANITLLIGAIRSLQGDEVAKKSHGDSTSVHCLKVMVWFSATAEQMIRRQCIVLDKENN